MIYQSIFFPLVSKMGFQKCNQNKKKDRQCAQNKLLSAGALKL